MMQEGNIVFRRLCLFTTVLVWRDSVRQISTRTESG